MNKIFTPAQYREFFGWRVDEATRLPMGDGIVGVTVQRSSAVKTIETMKRQETIGPLLDLGRPSAVQGDLQSI